MRTASPPAPEIRFLASPLGNWAMLAASLVAFAGAAFWARRSPRRQRALGVATGAAVGLSGFSLVAYARGWWKGPFFELQPLTELAMFLPLTAAYYAFWLGGYDWLARRTGHPFLTGLGLSLSAAPLVLAIEPWEIRRGYLELGGGYRVAHNAALSPLLIGLPMAAFQALQQRAESRPLPSAPRPVQVAKRHLAAGALREAAQPSSGASG